MEVNLSYREIEVGTAEYEEALRLREAVLRGPLGLTLTTEELADEANCWHLAGFAGSELRAILLLKPIDPATVKMRQVAVDPELQGRGIGAQLIAFAEEFARQKGCRKVYAHARATALGFYRKIGYVVEGEEFLETTIPHRLVTKGL